MHAKHYVGAAFFGYNIDSEISQMVDEFLKIFQFDLGDRVRRAVPAEGFVEIGAPAPLLSLTT